MTSGLWIYLLPTVLGLMVVLLFWPIQAYRTTSPSLLAFASSKSRLSAKWKRRCDYCRNVRPAFGHGDSPPPPPPLPPPPPYPPLPFHLVNGPPPPPSHVSHIALSNHLPLSSRCSLPSARQLRNELSALYSNDIKLDEDGRVELTSLQHLLFKDSTGRSSNDCGDCVSLLEYAGMVSPWIHQNDVLMKQLASSLLVRLQAIAAPAPEMPIERYRAEQLVKLLNHDITCSANGKHTRGILEGAAYIPDLPNGSERLRLRIRGTDVWEVLVDVSSLSDGSTKLSIFNDEDGETDEFGVLLLEP